MINIGTIVEIKILICHFEAKPIVQLRWGEILSIVISNS